MPHHARPPALAAVGDQPLTRVPGVAAASAERFAARGFTRVQDLWFLLPRGYEDRTRLTAIAALQPGVPALVEARIEAVERGFRYRPQLRVALDDDSRHTLLLRFFHFRNQQVAALQPGRRLRCFGTARLGAQGLEMVHPAYQLLDDDSPSALDARLTPVYPQLEGVPPATLRRVVQRALDLLPDDADFDLLPLTVRREHALPPLPEALRQLHRPAADADIAALLAGRHPAQRRLALEELLAHQIGLRRQRLAMQQHRARSLRASGALADRLCQRLPFALTRAQRRVLTEIRADLAQQAPMQRLVQGDVGSGKTAVAALAALDAIECGVQAALMAPTELLAEQHGQTLRGWLEPLGIEVVWLGGKLAAREKRAALARLGEATPCLAVGTHALMQSGVAFGNLGLVIVDEQHRFGVQQRLALRDKGQTDADVPHQLVLTATPIPRTLAMAAYADLDVSSIDELPPGRTPVQTVVLGPERRTDLIERIRAACADGRQAYWVCTVIEEMEPGSQPGRGEAQAAERAHVELAAALPGLRIGLVHGRMKPAQKQQVMRAFKDATLDLLVATTVIEVGVDVPNASLMVVENAERLGLAQLHQLRGRVGRGAQASSCVLLYQPPLSALARERLDILRRSQDGFVIAEKDLELRGPGELLGTRQAGLVNFRIADLARDADLLPLVSRIAERLLADDPALAERIGARWLGAAARYAAA